MSHYYYYRYPKDTYVTSEKHVVEEVDVYIQARGTYQVKDEELEEFKRRVGSDILFFISISEKFEEAYQIDDITVSFDDAEEHMVKEISVTLKAYNVYQERNGNLKDQLVSSVDNALYYFNKPSGFLNVSRVEIYYEDDGREKGEWRAL